MRFPREVERQVAIGGRHAPRQAARGLRRHRSARDDETPGVVWLQRIAGHFGRSVWINPEPATAWDRWQTTRLVRRLFPMFPLTTDGVTDAMRALVGSRV